MVLFFAALAPVLCLIALIGFLKIPPIYSALVAFLTAVVVATFCFNQKIFLIVMSIAEGVSLAIWPMVIIIFAAIFSYNFITATGRMETVKKLIISASSEKSVLVLLLVWGLGNFLEGIAGYGTAVAIPIGIMIALGFSPFFSAFVCLLGNTVSTGFGAIGIPAITLSIMADINPNISTAFIVLQLIPITVLIPFLLIVLTEKSFKKALKYFPEALAASLGFGITHFLVAIFLGPQLPTITGAIAGMVFVVIVSSVRKKRALSGAKDQAGIKEKPTDAEDANINTKSISSSDITQNNSTRLSAKNILNALSVYFLLLIFIALVSPLFPQIKCFMDSLSTKIKFYPGEAGKTITFYWLTTPGILIFLAVTIVAIADIFITKKPPVVFFATLIKTFKNLIPSMLTIIFLVSSAMIMRYSGMIEILAKGTSAIAGSFYPFFSPFVGALGTFITGSDTSSCILFGEFQKRVALDLGINEYWLTAANMSGATAGKMISPQSIAIAAAAAGIAGQESALFRKTAFFCLFYVIFLGLVIFFFSDVSPLILSRF
ncbi:MAG: lactate permease LctP family transporter [Spirochaetaceae bacterium]|nr:lactate permease LctP family transporter [Spirochaetaceae bacterium]